MATKKALVLLYTGMSLSEINLLTNYLTIHQPDDQIWTIDTVAAEKIPYATEDQFLVTPTKIFSEIDFSDYEIIIFPGIINPYLVAEDKQLLQFLQPLKTMSNRPLISAISSSPMLLAKAGILEDVTFTSGLFEETLDEFSFFQKENILRQPLVYDAQAHILTAIGFAFREFAIESAKLLGFELPETKFTGPRKAPPYTADELTFYRNPPQDHLS
ncbi:DJ-1/PfpI family protein [Enterococcus saccharolyticus]|uniref:DJ-1/PfpI domain-containing protein n=1 Tax=Candidatus Enterococcus willemsii TaxID=1857215 RepID=A0ABQ6Z3Z0_9ENTE|nr:MULTISPECIES: DJ-1/PfpI family protein [Enterococcus]KAF1306190.1 hypothetical protein BAU17_10910 [Enterococcus sp. CU12B]MCD5003345.1 DJ-1/PfpI family protein [Enterococcus saccharolyticus]